MKRISAFLLSFLLMLSVLPLSAYASDEENVGWVHITVDAQTNRPADFHDYNFFVNIVNEETGAFNLVNVYYDNDYKAMATLPYGNYFIAEAGVKNDWSWNFALNTGEKFTLDENTHAVDVSLHFDRSEAVVSPSEEPEPITFPVVWEPVDEPYNEPVEPPEDEPVETPPAIDEPTDIQDEPVEETPNPEIEDEQGGGEEENSGQALIMSFVGFAMILMVAVILFILYKKFY